MDENSLREKIARVIDPDAFDMSDCDYPIAIARAKLRQNAAYAKADVILAALPKQEGMVMVPREPTEDSVREAFERWFLKDDNDERAIVRNAHGHYVLMQAHIMWIAWKAAYANMLAASLHQEQEKGR